MHTFYIYFKEIISKGWVNKTSHETLVTIVSIDIKEDGYAYVHVTEKASKYEKIIENIWAILKQFEVPIKESKFA